MLTAIVRKIDSNALKIWKIRNRVICIALETRHVNIHWTYERVFRAYATEKEIETHDRLKEVNTKLKVYLVMWLDTRRAI